MKNLQVKNMSAQKERKTDIAAMKSMAEIQKFKYYTTTPLFWAIELGVVIDTWQNVEECDIDNTFGHSYPVEEVVNNKRT